MTRLINALLFFSLAGTSFVNGQEPKQPETHPITAFVSGNQQFAFEFYHQLQSQRGNLFFSPYSISTAFGMAAAGAKGNTAEEMFNALHMNPSLFPAISQLNSRLITTTSQTESSPKLHVANAAWVQQDLGLLETYRKFIQEDFGAPFNKIDFQNAPGKAVQIINNWVVDQTNGKIKNLLSDGDIFADTKLVLTTAIYMKAKWLHVFNEYATKKAPFHLDEKTSVDMDMMEITDFFPLYIDTNLSVIQLPYVHDYTEGPQLAMMIVLPKNPKELGQIETEMSSKQFQNWLTNLERQKVHLTLPKFKLETKMDLNALMQKLGIKLAFTPQADFSGITGRSDLYISKSIHQTFISVDESGTEAAAATAITMRTTSMFDPHNPYEFRADHPFVYIILDTKTNAILFMGRLDSEV